MQLETSTGKAGQKAELSPLSKLAYGVGSIAYGVKDNGFSYFLLIFYSQVIGLDARLVGLAITLALVIDAISDVIVGYWSDNFRSKWGRRHPFMYAAAAPVGILYFLLWAPPAGWSDGPLFWYVLVVSILIRTAITFYETPSSALSAELTNNYDQRSSLIAYRYFFGWSGGNAMSVMMFVLIFPSFVTATIANGQFNRDAYELYGVIAALLMVAAILTSAVGTHSRIAYMRPPPSRRSLTLRLILKDMRETLANQSFFALFASAAFGAVGAGLSASLTFYFLTYFWKFSSIQIGIVAIGVFVSAVIGSLLAPIATRAVGKKKAAMIVGLLAVLGSPLPIALKLFGWLPDDPGSVFTFVLLAGVIDVGLIVCFQVLVSSMTADLVEQAELKTSRRSEGLFFAVSTFTRKLVQGFGVMAAGLLLSLAQFPQGAAIDEVSDATIWRLGAFYVPTILVFWLAMVFVIAFYKLERSDHEENLRQLAQRAAARQESHLGGP